MRSCFGGRKLTWLAVFWLSGSLGMINLQVFANQSVMLSWNPSVSTNVVGYNIYFVAPNGDYTNELSAGNATNLMVSGLVDGTTYYFAATAVDSSGVQSAFSGQVSYTVPIAAVTLGSPEYSSNGLSFTVTGNPGYNYAIQTSTNLLSWTSLETNTSPWLFVDTNAKDFQQRFYRSVYSP
jgi:hypothetical protein